jgi:hypothetical protein
MKSYSLLPIGPIVVALIVGAHPTYGQTGAKLAAPPAQASANAEEETLKERLSDKASDEQRVDNCKVPLDRRGTKSRPEGCKPDEAHAHLPKQP